MKVNNFVKIKIYFLNILLLLIFNSNTCNEYKTNNKVECNENNISDFIQLQLGCNKDSVLYGDTVIYSLSFVNKTDSVIRFYPKSIMTIRQEPFMFVSNATASKLLSGTIDVTKYVDIKPKESYILHYKDVICKENLLFYKKGTNNIHILFFYGDTFYSKWKKTQKNMGAFKYCGYLKSNEVTIYIK